MRQQHRARHRSATGTKCAHRVCVLQAYLRPPARPRVKLALAGAPRTQPRRWDLKAWTQK